MVYAVVVLGIWILILTFFFIRFGLFFKKLTGGTKESELLKVLNRILETQKNNGEDIKKNQQKVAKLAAESKFHFQKIGLIRFNPFKEIGGDHSFALALLDGNDFGIVITCLHTRERTRVYLKGVRAGKAELSLSDEEKMALTKALNGSK